MAAIQCPKCKTELKDDYGMVNCAGCGSIVFVDMEGMVHVSSESDEPILAQVIDPAPAKPGFTPDGFTASGFHPAKGTDTPLGPGAANTSNEPVADFASFEPMTPATPQESPVTESPGEPEVANMDAFLGYETEPEPETKPPSQIDPKDPLGISAYANSEISGAKDGPLVVTLVISGIDTKDIRDEVRQVLKDSRFGWDVAQVMSQVRGGVLRIEQISPVKATIVVNRVKSLAVRVQWEQSAITDIEPKAERSPE